MSFQFHSMSARVVLFPFFYHSLFSKPLQYLPFFISCLKQTIPILLAASTWFVSFYVFLFHFCTCPNFEMHFLKISISGIILICRLEMECYLYISDSFDYFCFSFFFSWWFHMYWNNFRGTFTTRQILNMSYNYIFTYLGILEVLQMVTFATVLSLLCQWKGKLYIFRTF